MSRRRDFFVIRGSFEVRSFILFSSSYVYNIAKFLLNIEKFLVTLDFL